ncbi:hypothetical protein ECFRIK2001_0119, partial [Escherichia coli FRIK2001]
APP